MIVRSLLPHACYQVFSQPFYASFERWFIRKYPESVFVHGELKEIPSLRLNLLRLCFRTAYVGLTTGFAIIFPYFNQVVGLGGSVIFWPVVIYFPVEMYLVQRDIGAWTSKSIILRLYCFLTLIVMVFAFLGSVKGLIDAKLSV